MGLKICIVNANVCNMQRLLLEAENNREIDGIETGLKISVVNGGCLLHAGWNKAESTVTVFNKNVSIFSIR